MKFRFKVFAALLALLACVSAVSCDKPADPVETTAAPETTVEETTASPVITTDETTEETVQPGIIEVNWNFGYVGSDQNKNGFAFTINPDGVGYSYSDVFIVEKAGTRITFTDPSGSSSDNTVFIISSWYEISDWLLDMQGIMIRGNDTRVISSSETGTTYTYVTSTDNEALRICYPSGQQSADASITHPPIYFEVTNEPGTGTGLLSEEELLQLWLDTDKERAFYEILKGKTFTVIGDSYLDRASLESGNTWPTLLAKKYGMTYKNYGIGGSTISNFVTHLNPMVDRYNAMAMNDPDIIIVQGGRNDYNVDVPMGTLESTDTKTMMGATRFLITKLQERYPDALIIGLTCWETGGNKNDAGHYCREYGQAMLAVCADLGIPCINALDQGATGVYMTEQNFRSKYCIAANDISHLNDDGMRLVFPFFEKTIAEFYEASTKNS